MSHASSSVIDEPANAGARPASRTARPASSPARETRRVRARATSNQAFLDHHFRRLDPEVAASFTEAQRDAIATMFGARQIANHAIELRRSVPLPNGRRFYLVLLLGSERRGVTRLFSQDMISQRFNIFSYLGVGALCLIPILAVLYIGGF